MHKDLIKLFEEKTPDQLSAFFFDNAIAIDQLIRQYDAWNLVNTNQQSQRILDIKKAIRHLTSDRGWTDIDGLELCYQLSRPGIPAINIEAGFASTRTQPTGQFVISVTTMGIQAWNYYEDKLLTHYRNTEPVIATHKTLLTVATITGDHQDKILASLEQVYTFLLNITEQSPVYSVPVTPLS